MAAWTSTTAIASTPMNEKTTAAAVSTVSAREVARLCGGAVCVCALCACALTVATSFCCVAGLLRLARPL